MHRGYIYGELGVCIQVSGLLKAPYSLPSLTHLFNRTPSQLLGEAFSHAVIKSAKVACTNIHHCL